MGYHRMVIYQQYPDHRVVHQDKYTILEVVNGPDSQIVLVTSMSPVVHGYHRQLQMSVSAVNNVWRLVFLIIRLFHHQIASIQGHNNRKARQAIHKETTNDRHGIQHRKNTTDKT